MIKRILFMMMAAALVLSLCASSPAQADQTLQLTPCKLQIGMGSASHDIDAQCGRLTVPEDWSNPAGQKLDIHLAVLSATDQAGKLAPIFHLEGGPGGSAITSFGRVWYSAYQGLRENHDIVLIDQRGTGLSNSLQCTEFVDAAFTDLAKAQTPEQDRQESRQRLDTCLKSLSQKTDPAHYTSFAMAADTNAIRESLGYDKIDVFGTSYGTWLGQIYLGLYGSTVNGILLEGVVGPWNNPYLRAGSNFEASLNHVFDACKADTTCNQAYPDLAGKLNTALDSLKAKPLQVSGLSSLTGKAYPVVMTPNRLLGTLREMLGQGSAVASIPKTINDAADGVYTYAAAIQVSLAEQSDSISLGLFQSVVCAESVAFFTDNMIKQYMTGSFYGLGDELILDIVDSCKGWRSAELDAAQLAPVKSERPVLIFSGGFDPITPVAFGEETNQRLSHSTLAVFPYEGHGVLPFSGCAQSLAAQFFKTPEAPIDTKCTTRDAQQVFDGTYTVDWTPYQDPGGKFSVQIPKDWEVLPAKESDSNFTFFASPKGTSAQRYLGVWNSTSTTGGAAALQSQAEAALKAQFGALDLATTLTMGSVTISQYSLTAPDEVYAGVLLIFSVGQNARVVWYAAPLNAFSATFSEIAIKVLTSLSS